MSKGAYCAIDGLVAYSSCDIGQYNNLTMQTTCL